MYKRYMSVRALVGFIASVALVAAATYGAIVVSGVDLGGSGSAEPSQPDDQAPDNWEPDDAQADANYIRLLSSNRDRLAICVQLVSDGAAVQGGAKSAVEATLPTLSQSPSWTKYDYSNPPPLVEEGCPPPALYDASLNPESVASLFDVRGRKVSQPSYYRVHVFVAPAGDIARLTVSSAARRTAEELTCEGDTCDEVTTGLYVSAAELEDTPFMVRLLKNAIGLR